MTPQCVPRAGITQPKTISGPCHQAIRVRKRSPAVKPVGILEKRVARRAAEYANPFREHLSHHDVQLRHLMPVLDIGEIAQVLRLLWRDTNLKQPLRELCIEPGR